MGRSRGYSATIGRDVQIHNRASAPLPWRVRRDQIAPDCQWSLEGLLLSWPGWHSSGIIAFPGAFGIQNDPFRRLSHLSQYAHIDSGIASRCRTYRAAAGSTYFGNVQPLVAAMATDIPLPTGPATVVLHYKRLDGTNRAAGAVGLQWTGNHANNFGVTLPWSDGVIYFDYGGFAEGSTRLSMSSAGLTFGDDVWVFTTGARGMEIWQNGIKRASNGGNPTRTAAASYWGLFSTSIYASDFAESGCL